jgi:hypothetical protein
LNLEILLIFDLRKSVLGVFVRVKIGVNDTDQSIPFVESLQIGLQKKLLDIVLNTGTSISVENIKSLTECLLRLLVMLASQTCESFTRNYKQDTDTALADDLLEASKMKPNADEQSLFKVSSRSMRVHEKQGKTNEMITLEDGIAHFLYITEYRAWAQAYRDGIQEPSSCLEISPLGDQNHWLLHTSWPNGRRKKTRRL